MPNQETDRKVETKRKHEFMKFGIIPCVHVEGEEKNFDNILWLRAHDSVDITQTQIPNTPKTNYPTNPKNSQQRDKTEKIKKQY